MITIEFLEGQLYEAKHGWSPYTSFATSQSGNIHQMTDTIFYFQHHNLLPVDGRSLDGHYGFYVDADNFNYLVCQDSYYGSLTYTTPARIKGWTKLNEKDVPYVESIIADKLLGAYYFDHDAVNSQGKNLFSTGEVDKNPIGGFNKGIVRWEDGTKGSLIVEIRKETYKNIYKLSARDKKAIKILKGLCEKKQVQLFKKYAEK